MGPDLRQDDENMTRSRIQMSNSAAIKYNFAISRRDAPELCLKSLAL
jgi:hypothetical protein